MLINVDNGNDEITFREANIKDLDLITKIRVDFILDLRPCNDETKIDQIIIKTREYLKDAIIKNEFTVIIGERGIEPVCCAGLLIYRLPPLTHSINRLQGHVLNFYTYPEYRKMGYGKRLMEFVIQKAKEKNINSLFLNATEMGEGLYRKCGFYEPEDKAMILNIQ